MRLARCRCVNLQFYFQAMKERNNYPLYSIHYTLNDTPIGFEPISSESNSESLTINRQGILYYILQRTKYFKVNVSFDFGLLLTHLRAFLIKLLC